MWNILGTVSPSIDHWSEVAIKAENFSQVKLEFSENSNLALVKSRVVVRRNFGNFADQPAVVYPDVVTPVVIGFPEIATDIWPTIEVKKITWKRYKFSTLAEDYKVTVYSHS